MCEARRTQETSQEEFLHELTRQLHKYTISLILDGKFYGTGTLVEIDGVKGILTAEHVVHNPEGNRFDNSSGNKQMLDIPVTLYSETFPENLPEPETARFPVRGLRWYPEYEKNKSFGDWGPDLAFLRLDEGLPQVGSLKAKRSFWNLNKNVSNGPVSIKANMTSLPFSARLVSGLHQARKLSMEAEFIY